MMNKKLIRNKIKCNLCGDIIESKTVHDFRWCKCNSVYIDGGLEYARRGFKNSSADYEDLSEWADIED